MKTLTMGGSPGDISEELVTQEEQKKGWRMNCDVGEATERLENELCMGGSPGDVSKNPVVQEKRKKGCRMSCDVGEATEGFENEL